VSNDNFYWNFDNCSGACCPFTPSSSWYLNPIDAIIRADPNIPPGINYYLTTSETKMNEVLDANGDCIAPPDIEIPDGSCSQNPSQTDFNLSSRVHGPNYWLIYEYRKECADLTGLPFEELTRGWQLSTFSIYIRHEIGHSYGLGHRCGDIASCSASNLMTDSDNSCIPNGDGTRAYLDNNQIGIMHRSLGRSNLRQFVCCDETYGVPRIVEADETWDFDQRLYQDVIVQTGATLRLTCNHLMPKDGKIIVERGARLIIDGATVTRANTCEGEEKWDGIFLRGNNAKGHTPSMLDENAPLVSDNPAILIIKNDATIEYADRAIQTENDDLSFNDRIHLRNGLVSATDVTFRNNFVSCGFMIDDQIDLTPNLNLSHFTRCDFLDEDGTADFGVINWRTDNVLFDDCEFNGLNRGAIQAHTAGITIKNSRFYGNGTGTLLNTTGIVNQSIVIGTPNEPNEYRDNGTGIKAIGINRLNVIGNTFTNNFHGIFCMGESEFLIEDNTFDHNIYSIGLENTGRSSKLSKCNSYESNPFFSLNIYGAGENIGIQFMEETFLTPVFNVLLTSAGNIPGTFGTQGANGNARYNYFQHNSLSSRFATSSSTVPFIYWYPRPNGSNSETRPYCTINEDANCSTINNFNSFRTGGHPADCSEIGAPDDIEISTGVLDNLRLEEKDIELQIANNGSTSELESELNRVRWEKELVIAGLMEQWLATANYSEIEDMLIAEQTLHSTKKLIGLKLLIQDFTAANALLILLPHTQDTYKRIQSINIDRLTTAEYVLPVNDREFLQSVATQKISDAAAAQSILSLLEGEEFAIIPPDIPANTYSQEGAGAAKMPREIVIAPNPARNLIRVDLSTPLEPVERQLLIFNTQGAKIYSVTVKEGETSKFIQLDDFSPGLYYLNIIDNEGKSEIQKFIIQR